MLIENREDGEVQCLWGAGGLLVVSDTSLPKYSQDTDGTWMLTSPEAI